MSVHQKEGGILFSRISILYFLNLILLLFGFYALSSLLAGPAVIYAHLPKSITSGIQNLQGVTVVITGENLLYINNKVVTLEELKNVLSQKHKMPFSVFVKADRRASMGRIVDVWDLGRSCGVESINVASTQE